MHTQYKLATTKKGNQNMIDYFQKMRSLSDNLAVVGQPISSNALITCIFAGLGQKYDPFVTFVQTRVDPLSLDELYGLLLTHEQRLEQHLTIATDLSFSTANMAARNSSPHGHGGQFGRGFSSNTNSGRGNWGRGRGSPSSSNGRGSSSSFGPPLTVCQVCNKPGHAAITCYHRFDHSYQLDNPTLAQAQAFYSSQAIIDDNWYPDTGATHHMTPDISNLNLNCDEYLGKIGNGRGLPITHTGTASLSTPSLSFRLNNILHVPSACANLLLVSQFAKDNSIFFEFYANSFLIKDLLIGRILHRGPLKHGLYPLLPSTSTSSPAHAFIGERTSTSNWHNRLGHPNFRIVRQVLSTFDLPVQDNKKLALCPACS
jgi:hypothetical protein